MKRRILINASALLFVASHNAFWAQDKWPSKSISYIVPFPAGGTTAILGRLIGQKLGPVLGLRSDAQFIHMPYKGSSPAIADVMGDQVDMMFDTTVVAGPHIQTGKVRALAVTSAKRMESLPSVPTVANSGLPGWPGFEVVSWQGIFAPAGTPEPIIDQLHNEIVKILQQADMQERLKGLGMQPSTLTTEQFAAFQKILG